MQFRIRGLVEGFYGTPWTVPERTSALATLARHGLNAYYYGPKDDPFCCERWFAPYDREGLDALTFLFQEAARHGIAMHYMLAPGFSISYASAADRERLIEKYRQVYAIGVRSFVLLLDDIPERLAHAEDSARYASLVDAHIDLANGLWTQLQALPEKIFLAVCPTQYWGAPDGEYIVRLGRALPPEIGLMFTGDRICSWRISSAEARAFAAHTGHRPLYWDNYPVNDAEMTGELHIGALIGRDADLSQYAEGMIMNPMPFQEASMISLITAADYMNDPQTYDPVRSHAAAVEEVLGAAYVEPLRWLDNLCYKSCLLRHGVHYANAAPERYHPSFGLLLAEEDPEGLLAFAAQTRRYMAEIRACPNQAFVRQAEPWLDACDAFANAVGEAVRLHRDGAREAAAAPLTAYLNLPQDVMKHEAKALIAHLSGQPRDL